MKTLSLSFIILCGLFSHSQATVFTCSNSPLGGAQYSSIYAAVTAASAGDTILVEGTDIEYNSPYAYGKQLVIIGNGFNPDVDQNKKTILGYTNGVAQQFLNDNGDSGTKFYGITFSRRVSSGTSSNVLFENCKFNDEVFLDRNNATITNYQFINCIFDETAKNVSTPGIQTKTVSFLNCVFDGWIDGGNNPNAYLIFDHCLFLEIGWVIGQLSNTSVTNCIFMNQTSIDFNITYSAFNNNISRLDASLPAGTGNLMGDPNFVNYTSGTFYDPTYDFDVQAGSIAIGAGSDGTDIGVHGGSTNFSETGEVLITPIIRSTNLLNSTVTPGGTLNIEVVADQPSTD